MCSKEGHVVRNCKETRTHTLQCQCGHKSAYVLLFGEWLGNKSCRRCGRLGRLRIVLDEVPIQRDPTCGGWVTRC